MTKVLPVSVKVLEVPLSTGDVEVDRILEMRSEIEKREKELFNLKMEYEYAKSKRIVSIPWRDEIRVCLDLGGEEFCISNSTNLASCVANRHFVDVSADIKNKIATTLSTMHRQGELGRIDVKGRFYYADKRFFKDDMSTIKDEYIDLLKDLK